MRKERLVATLTVHGAPALTKTEAKAFLRWLLHQSVTTYLDRKGLAGCYSGRLFLPERKKKEGT